MSVTIEIPGRPVAKQRARSIRPGVFYTPTRTRRYEELVAGRARDAGTKIKGEIVIEIALMTRRRLTGDIDNYAKSILDGIVKGGLIDDDSEVVSLSISKSRVIAEETDRVWVTVEPGEW